MTAQAVDIGDFIPASGDVLPDARIAYDYRVAADGDLVPEADFCAIYGITSTGAVLIRPDGHIAFRAQEAPPDPGEFLCAALRTVLRIQ